MNNLRNSSKNLSRRNFLGTTAAAAAVSLVPLNFSCAAPAEKEESAKSGIGGVHVGTITYSFRSLPGGLENVVKYCRESEITTIELMGGDLESYLGAPVNPMTAIRESMTDEQRKKGELTPDQKALVEKYSQDLKDFRENIDMSKVAAAKKLLDDAGIDAHIVKFSPSRWSDEEIEYAFKVAKAMGAKGVSEEISERAAKKLAPFAEKHDMFAVFHQHMQFADIEGFSYDPFIEISPAIRFNFDAGHFFGSTGIHPNEIISKYHERIFSIHLKDKTGPKTDPANTNQVWGQGEMPLEDVLRLIQKENWPIYCDIELEYEVKPWSNAVKEVKTCVNYAKRILMC